MSKKMLKNSINSGKYYYSPLRYPGGKNKLAKFLAEICITNNIKGHYVEPYAGGAAVALYLLINGLVDRITINDIDRSIFAFWYSILNETDRFCNKIRNTQITIENWRKMRSIQREKSSTALFDLGFSTFFLNRTNISGIIDGGVIGGLDQKGKYKIDCRFNKKELINRIKIIAQYKNKISLSKLDAMVLVGKINRKEPDEQTIFYFDPPYYFKGESLYFSHYEYDDHEAVSREIKKIKNARWVVSYDNTPEIKNLYKGVAKKEYQFFHMAREARTGKEILFFSKNLVVPRISEPTRI